MPDSRKCTAEAAAIAVNCRTVEFAQKLLPIAVVAQYPQRLVTKHRLFCACAVVGWVPYLAAVDISHHAAAWPLVKDNNPAQK
jgi:hypothetical protein